MCLDGALLLRSCVCTAALSEKNGAGARGFLFGSRGVPVLVPVRASPVPSVVRGSFVVNFSFLLAGNTFVDFVFSNSRGCERGNYAVNVGTRDATMLGSVD